jgi:hypothetical protein
MTKYYILIAWYIFALILAFSFGYDIRNIIVGAMLVMPVSAWCSSYIVSSFEKLSEWIDEKMEERRGK